MFPHETLVLIRPEGFIAEGSTFTVLCRNEIILAPKYDKHLQLAL